METLSLFDQKPRNTPPSWEYLKIPALLMALLLTSIVAVFFYWAMQLSEVLFEKKISLSLTAEIRQSIRIPLREIYDLRLHIRNRGRTTEQMEKVFGDPFAAKEDEAARKGIIIPVDWKLIDDKGSVAAGRQTNTDGLTGWGDDFCERQIDPIQVNRGRYEFRFRLLKELPELKDEEAVLKIEVDPKGAHAWQTDFVLVGSFVVPVIILPLALLCWVIWLILAFKDKEEK